MCVCIYIYIYIYIHIYIVAYQWYIKSFYISVKWRQYAIGNYTKPINKWFGRVNSDDQKTDENILNVANNVEIWIQMIYDFSCFIYYIYNHFITDKGGGVIGKWEFPCTFFFNVYLLLRHRVWAAEG